MHHMFVSSAATMGGRRFFNTGGIITQSLVKRDMFRVGSNLYHCNKSHMLPNFVRSLAFSSASQSSGQTPNQEPKEEEKKWQIIRNSQLQRERPCDDISSTQVKLNQFPGLMVHGMVENSKTRRLLRLNPDTGYFEQEQEQEQDVAAAANHDHSQHNELQVPHEHVCRGSAYGWLFLTDDNLDMKLLNLFSGAEIQLPPMYTLPPSEEDEPWAPLSKWCVRKAVFSANPSIEPRPVVFIIYEGRNFPRLAFCKPGDEVWTPLEFPIKRHFQRKYLLHRDAVYHKGQFYVLSSPEYVAAFDIGRRIHDDDLSVKTTLVATAAKRERFCIHVLDHLVMLDGELVRFELRAGCFRDCCIEETKEMIEKEKMRDGGTTDEEYDFYCTDAIECAETETETVVENEDEEEDGDNDNDVGKKECTCRLPDCVDMNHPLQIYGIKIRRFDESEKQWVKVESLGDKAVFLGYNTSFAISASDYPAGHCIPNSIYFTYSEGGFVRTDEKVCYDTWIYNMKDKSIKRPLYQDDDSEFKKPAPIWIVNSADT